MALLLRNGGEKMERPNRKRNRLRNYDYSTPGAYFITICTQDRKCLLWDGAGTSIARPQDVQLSKFGRITEQAVKNIPRYYPAVRLEKYVIMPNHMHLLLRIEPDVDGRPMVAPTISTVVQQMKGYITKQIGQNIWQKLFHDHIIRTDAQFQRIWNYIEANPMLWADDCFYME